MNTIVFIPFVIAIVFSLLIRFALDALSESINESRFRKARAISFRKQFLSPKKVGRKFTRGIVKFDLEMIDLADSVVKSRYRTLLQSLSDKSGTKGDQALRRLFRTKIYIVIIGFFLSFLISIGSQYQLLPITLGLTLLAYLAPSLLKSMAMLASSGYGKRLSRLVAFQGVSNLSTVKLFRLKLYSSLTVFLICYLYTVLTEAAFSRFFYSLLFTVLGFFLPDLFLYNKVMKRRELFEQLFPEAIDLLSMCVNAGLAFPAALAKVSESQEGPVAEELARVNAEVSLGKERVEALREMASRVNLDSLQEFVSSVSQVDRFGIPISRALAEQSRELRAKRKALGREKAQKVPIKILGPIMLCFLPCVILIVLAPAMIGVFNII